MDLQLIFVCVKPNRSWTVDLQQIFVYIQILVFLCPFITMSCLIWTNNHRKGTLEQPWQVQAHPGTFFHFSKKKMFSLKWPNSSRKLVLGVPRQLLCWPHPTTYTQKLVEFEDPEKIKRVLRIFIWSSNLGLFMPFYHYVMPYVD